MRLLDKVGVITGAARGVGRGCAEAFAREGARVVVADRNAATGVQVAQMICAAGGDAILVSVDVTLPEQVEAMVARAVRAFGRVDVIMFDAGYGRHILLGGDMARRSYWKAYGGGPGFDYLLTVFTERLRGEGFSDGEITAIWHKNPAKWLVSNTL
jgi:NAD(P)-dependent dehydrogenase (short-subunit alcohol dehydrogenase family)